MLGSADGKHFLSGAWGVALVRTTRVTSEHLCDSDCACRCGKRVDAVGVDISEAHKFGACVLRGGTVAGYCVVECT